MLSLKFILLISLPCFSFSDVSLYKSYGNGRSLMLYNNSAASGRYDLSGNIGIVCAGNSETTSISWHHPNGVEVSNDSTARIFSLKVTGSQTALKIELLKSGQFQRQHNGLYTCILRDRSNITQNLYLGVYDTDKLNVQPTVGPLTAGVDSSDNEVKLILGCSSAGLPATNVYWYFEERNITVDGTRRQIIPNKSSTNYSSSLTIRRSDIILQNGLYRCGIEVSANQTSIITMNATQYIMMIPPTPMQPRHDHTEGRVSWVSVETGHHHHFNLRYDVLYEGGHCNNSRILTKPLNITSVSLMELGLEGGASYAVRVRARNEFTHGNWSELTKLQTSSKRPTGTPLDLRVVPNLNYVLLTWSEVNCSERNSRITHYIVSYAKASASDNTKKHINVVDLKVKIEGLQPVTSYVFAVAAVNEAMEEGPAQNITAQTSTEIITIICASSGGAVVVIMCLFVSCCILVSRLHARKYRLRTQNLMDFDESELEQFSVSNEPIIHDFPEDFEACEGEYVIMYVSVSGRPPPAVTWYCNSASIDGDPSFEVSGDGTLSIPCMEEEHIGTYRLVASNINGSCYREVRLDLEKEDTFTVKRAESIASMIDNAPVPLSSFEEYVALQHCKNNEAFHFQFVCLNQYTDMDVSVGSETENKIYNRFRNILPYDENLLHLNPIPGSNCLNEYINASYIDGHTPNKFIATQGPLPHTVVDFWRLVWQEKTAVIVMLCNIVEGHRVRCQQYWPETGSHIYGPIFVQKLGEEASTDLVIRHFKLSLTGNAASEARQLGVTHYQFKGWPDHSVPDTASAFFSLVDTVTTLSPDSDDTTQTPILVHCSAGVGRTGVFIALDTALNQAREDGQVDIMGIVNNMRAQRMKMVQTLEQYIFIHDATLEALVCGETRIQVTNFRFAWMKLNQIDREVGKMRLEKQFEVLQKITPQPFDVERKAARKHPELNRSMEFLPRDQKRVILNKTGSNYIHATFTDGYKQKKAFIVAQGPLENTCSDFWHMIHQYSCGTIVMLSELVEYQQEVCHRYWPYEGEASYGSFSVKLLSEHRNKDIITRELSLSAINSEIEPCEVIQFQLKNWTPDGLCADYHSVAELIRQVVRAQIQTGNHPIVIHCSDTVSRSAIFCAAMTAIECFKVEAMVDIYQIVKTMRMQKPSSVLTIDQYSAIFFTVLAYVDSIDSSDYANFQNLSTQ